MGFNAAMCLFHNQQECKYFVMIIVRLHASDICIFSCNVKAYPDLMNESCMFLSDVKYQHDFEVEVTWLHIRLSAVTYLTATDSEWEEK